MNRSKSSRLAVCRVLGVLSLCFSAAATAQTPAVDPAAVQKFERMTRTVIRF